MIQVVMLGDHRPLGRWVHSLTDIDFAPLMQEWEQILVEDNRKGVLEGTDGFDQPAPELVYRFGAGQATAARSGVGFGTAAKRFKGFSGYTGGKRFKRLPFPGKRRREYRLADAAPADMPRRRGGPWNDDGPAILPNNNLSTGAYQRLTGPRLAPRREASRVIANYHTRHGRDEAGWFAEGAWVDVVTPDGEELLPYHFNGWGVPKYDLRGVRRWGLARAADELQAFVRKKLRPPASSGDFATGWTQLREIQ
jgi:hypothetical protein